MFGFKRERLLPELKDPDTGAWLPKEIFRFLRNAFAVVLSLVIVVGGTIFGGMKAWEAYDKWRTAEDYINTAGTADVVVTIPAGSTLTAIGDILVQNDVVRSTKAFSRAAASDSKAQSIQAGKYKLRTQIPAKTALAMLEDPKNIVHNKLTVIEGLRLADQVASLAQQTGVPVEQWNAALAKPEELGLVAYAQNHPEGFLFPDTYEYADNPNPTDVLKTMATKFQQVSDNLGVEEKAAALGLSPLQAIVVASIIDAEVNKEEYRPMVARAIYNRLKVNMPLQLDTTVNYATGKSRNVFTTDADRAVDSPYNTYKNTGLPPFPIDAPSEAAIRAALNPADGDYLYWVVINVDTGETAFAKTYEEHQQNVAKLQAWCKANPGKCGS